MCVDFVLCYFPVLTTISLTTMTPSTRERQNPYWGTVVEHFGIYPRGIIILFQYNCEWMINALDTPSTRPRHVSNPYDTTLYTTLNRTMNGDEMHITFIFESLALPGSDAAVTKRGFHLLQSTQSVANGTNYEETFGI